MHTPGPWDASGWRVCAGLGKGERISVICDTANNKASRTEENRDNARLIAAAPDLLQALRESIRYSPFVGESEETEFVRMARKALAKATGEAVIAD